MRTLIIFGLRVWAKNRQFIDHPDYNMIIWGDSVLNCVKCSPQILGNMKPFWQWGFELVFQPHTTDHLSFAVTHHHLKTSPGQKNKTHIPKNRQQSDSTSQVQERLDPATKRTILHKTRRCCEWPKRQSFLIDVPFSWLVFFIIILVGGEIEWWVFWTSTCFWCCIFVGDKGKRLQPWKAMLICLVHGRDPWTSAIRSEKMHDFTQWKNVGEPVTHEINGTHGIFNLHFTHKNNQTEFK